MSKKSYNRRRSIVSDIILIFIIIILVIGGYVLGSSSKKESSSKSEVNISKAETKSNEVIKENSIANNNKYNNLNNNIQNNTKENNIQNIIEEEIEKSEKEKKKSEEKLPVWNDTAVQDIKDIYGSDEKQVYLTFDDGPSPDITPQILEILKEENVTATFFVLGKCVASYPELAKQEYEDGHFIANHGYTHTYSQIYASVDSVMNEYNMTNEEIKKAIGNEDYNCHLFRFPGGSSGGPHAAVKSQAKQYLAENEIASTNWNCLTSDAAGNNTVETQYQGALETQGNKTSLIVLMHDASGKKATPETLKLLIKHYKEEGYEFKNFYEIFKEKDEEADKDNLDSLNEKEINVKE